MIEKYLNTCWNNSWLDFWIIWPFGIILAVIHIVLIVRVLVKRKNYLPYQMARLKRSRDWLLDLCEFFPILGLLGTVFNLMGTLGAMENVNDLNKVLTQFAPALSTTISGLLYLAVNLILNLVLYFVLSFFISD